MFLNILYRGPLSSCNYGCEYCPFAKHVETAAELAEDRRDLERLMDAFRGLRVPRHLFKFLYRIFVAHCNAYTDDAPVWRVTSERFESILALYSRDQDAFDKGLKAG